MLSILFFSFCSLNSEEVTDPIEKTTSESVVTDSSPKKWGYVYSNSFQKFPENYKKFILEDYDILCITGLLFRGTGQLRFENEFINKLQNAGISTNSEKPIIYPMVALSSTKDGIQLLTNENSRTKSIENLKSFLKRYGFKGVHLDFENIPIDYASHLGEYLGELKKEINEDDIKLSFALFPQIDIPIQLRSFHKIELIAPNVDEIVFMAYDYHNLKTEEGCVSDKSWAENNIIEITKFISPSSLYLGIPSYGYEWYENSKRIAVISAREAERFKQTFPSERDESGCLKINKKKGKKVSKIYYSDKEFRKSLEELVGKYNLSGSAIWRLGLEEQ